MPLLSRSISLAAVTALALLATGCGGDGGTGPGPTKLADPLATAARLQALDANFGASTFQSFALASQYSPAAAASLTTVRAVLRAARSTLGSRRVLSPSESRRATSELRAAIAPQGTLAAVPVLPPEVLGKTFEWSTDPLVFGYVATDRPGAPSNGVRFILYALGADGPIVSWEIGYADFVDSDPGSASTARLDIRVVDTFSDPDITYLDYSITGTATATSGTASVVGYISDGVHRLDFNFTASETSNSLTFDISFDVNAENAHVRLQLTLSQPSPSTIRATVDFRVQFGSEVVTVTGSETVDVNTLESTGTYTVTVNRRSYATITITNGEPSYTGGGGQQLTADDLTALAALYDAIVGIFLRANELLAPVGG